MGKTLLRVDPPALPLHRAHRAFSSATHAKSSRLDANDNAVLAEHGATAMSGPSPSSVHDPGSRAWLPSGSSTTTPRSPISRQNSTRATVAPYNGWCGHTTRTLGRSPSFDPLCSVLERP